MNPWNAVYVASRHEKKVQDRLLARGIEAYAPLRRTLRQWSDRRKWVQLPLLPGYVLVKPAPAQRDAVLQEPGVVAYVRQEQQDAVVHQREVDVLRGIEELGYDAQVYAGDFTPGEQVRITQGPLKGLAAQIISSAQGNTVYAFLIEGLGQRIRVVLPTATLAHGAQQAA